jgi:primosomal replication protein N
LNTPAPANRVVVEGRVARVDVPRFTAAGLAVQRLRIEHQSIQAEAGGERQVGLALDAVMVGGARSVPALDDSVRLTGFLASARGGVELHVTEWLRLADAVDAAERLND